MDKAPNFKSLFYYSALAMPLAFAGLPLYIHAPDYYTRDLGLNLGLIGIILLFVRLFDAIQDPLIGFICDRFAHARTSIMSAGIGFLTLGMGFLFYGPPAFIPLSLWFALSLVMATTGYSLVIINLTMIGGFWQDDMNLRTKISAWREGFALIGLLIAASLPDLLKQFLPVGQAFQTLYWIFVILIIIAYLCFRRFLKSLHQTHKIHKQYAIKGQGLSGIGFFTLLFGVNRGFFAVCFLTHLSASIPGVLVLFFIRDYLGLDDLSGLFLLLYFLVGALFMPLWVKLARRYGKMPAWGFAMLLAMASFIWAFFLPHSSTGGTLAVILSYAMICIMSGIALGADLSLPPSILADRISAQKRMAEATQFYGLIAFIPKTALVLASAFAYLILNQIGFVAGAFNAEHSLMALAVLYALVPIFIKLLSFTGLIYLYKSEGNSYVKL